MQNTDALTAVRNADAALAAVTAARKQGKATNADYFAAFFALEEALDNLHAN